MNQYLLCFELVSDTIFGSGSGLAGAVDIDVQYDELGCPFIGGRTLKGLLVNECADILSAIKSDKQKKWQEAAKRLFGVSGQLLNEESILKIGDGKFPKDLRHELQNDLNKLVMNVDDSNEVTRIKERFRQNTLASITGIRAQTALDSDGVAKNHSLRNKRVIIRKTYFESELLYLGNNEKNRVDDFALLAASTVSLRRVGTNRDRGLGKVTAWLESENNISMEDMIQPFIKGVK